MSSEAVRAVHLHRTFGSGAGAVTALDDVNLTLARGTVAALLGPSGSGKSTLIKALGFVSPADRGAVQFEGRTVIDVRTVEEYDAGHIDGAERIGLADPDFAERIAALDPAETYVVYCRSGNRSAQAASVMAGAGLDVVDGGAMTDMVEAGWPAA